MTVDNWALAKINYDAYGDQVGWLNFQGKPMPTWEELPDSIKLGWLAGALAVRKAVKPDNPDRSAGGD